MDARPVEINIAGQAVVLGPEDRLVIALDPAMTHEEVDSFAATVRETELAGRIVVMAGVIDLAVLRRDG